MKWLKLPRTAWIVTLLILCLVPTLSASAQKKKTPTVVPTETPEPVFVVDLPTEPAVEWMNTLYRRIEAEAVSAPGASRIYGYAGVTMYESLLGGMPNNVTLSGQIYHLPDLPYPDEDTVYDWLSVMNGAMSTVLPKLFYKPSEATPKTFADLRKRQIADRTREVGREMVTTSTAFGDEIGMAILDWVAGDNFLETRAQNADYVLPTADPEDTSGRMYVATSDNPTVEPYWGSIRPFVLDGGYECNIEFDLEYSTDPDSTFYKQALEVVEVGRNLTPEQQETARYWIDSPAQTGTPAGHWISIAGQLVDQLDLTLDRTAMMYAMLGMAVADSFISCWNLKYELMVPRPITYIQANIRRNWQSYVQTPAFPEYPSGHSVVSAAAADILTGLFGTVAFKDETHILFGHEKLARSFTSFEAAASEAAISRLYGGIHYRAAIENGMKQGRCIGDRINNWITLSPVAQGE